MLVWVFSVNDSRIFEGKIRGFILVFLIQPLFNK